MDHLADYSTRHTPQTERTPGRTDEVRNSAGGYVFSTTPHDRLYRFLTLGVDRPTYYADTKQKRKDLAIENAEIVLNYARTDPDTLISTILDVSERGRAPKPEPALFALAIAASASTGDGRKQALAALPRVARTGGHLFTFAKYVEQHRGWGRGLRRAVGAWYAARDVQALAGEAVTYDRIEGDVAEVAYQAVKYRQRDGWTHRDLLRLSHGHWHIRSALAPGWHLSDDQRVLFDWICGRKVDLSENEHESLNRVRGFQLAQSADVKNIPALIRTFGLTWEMLPDRAMNQPEVWRALLDVGMPTTALIRQLPRLTRIGLFTRGAGDRTTQVVEQLTDETVLRKARIHPIQVLTAMRGYTSGRSKGGQSWEPARQIVDALDAAFYSSFQGVTPTGKRVMLALDASGSMSMTDFTDGHTDLHDRLDLVPREIAAAMCMATARVESDYLITAFRGHRGPNMDIGEVSLSPRQRLDDVLHTMNRLPFGGTDCSLPMRWALARKIPIDTFVVYTDNETWAGEMKVDQALAQYRQAMGIRAQLVVVGMTVTGFSIADPADPGCLDVAGFDSAVPQLISDFARGDL